MNEFFLEKTSPSPTLPFCMKISWQAGEFCYSSILIEHFSWRNLRKFLKTSTVVTQVDKICSRILWTWSAWHTFLVDIATLSCFNRCFSTNFCASPLPFYYNKFIAKLSAIFIKENFWTTPHVFTFDRNRQENSGYNPLLPQTSVGIPSWMGFWATTCCCLGPFWWESPRGWDF
jgi:hypothetical protein